MAFMSTPADIAIFGGAAGPGKSWCLEAEPMRHIQHPGFGAVIFRRTRPELTNKGGLWDEAAKMYIPLGARLKESPRLTAEFPNGNSVDFAQLQYDKSVYDYQSSQIPLIEFDELTHFSKFQFFYMITRSRSTCGIRPYVRAACNPDPDSWVKEFIAWWLDDNGDPIPKRSGVLRWFVNISNTIFWGDSRQELVDKYSIAGDTEGVQPKSVTFIHADVFSNKILMEKDPGYLANLKAQDEYLQAQLIHGNWNARPAGKLYSRTMFKIVDALPTDVIRTVRGWDEAATEEGEAADSDFTASCKVGQRESGKFIVLDADMDRLAPDDVDALQKSHAATDGSQTLIRLEQEPGSSGKKVAQLKIRMLAGYDVAAEPSTGSKLDRGKPALAQARVGNIEILRGPWNGKFLTALESFGGPGHDDLADAFHKAFNEVALGLDNAGWLEVIKKDQLKKDESQNSKR